MAASAPGKLGSKALSDELKRLGKDAHTIDDAGNALTRDEVLAALIWKQALGFTEKKRDDNGTMREIVHPPVAWCQQFLFERREGKAAVATQEEQQGPRAAETVRKLAVERMNALAEKALA